MENYWTSNKTINGLRHFVMVNETKEKGNISFLMVLCRDFGVASEKGITIDLRLSHQAIAEAIGSTRVTITRLLGDLKDSGLLNIERKKITVFDPIALAKRFN